MIVSSPIQHPQPTLASFFSGAGGLDAGFKAAGFNTQWANEFDKRITPTFRENFKETFLAEMSITDVSPDDIPDVDGYIGGPPCQSWSEAGARRGILDPRGQLFLTYVDLLRENQPSFFLAENVSGFLFDRNKEARTAILSAFADAGYNVSYGLLSAADYNVPQDRERVIIVGFRVDSGLTFVPPEKSGHKVTLRDALRAVELVEAQPVKFAERGFKQTSPITSHHFLDSEHFSFIYMSRNRVRDWDEQSFTIQASGSHAPLHPSAPKMLRTQDRDVFEFAPGSPYRRLSVRECALIQTFPADFKLLYDSVNLGYKVVGNAVPVEFAKAIASSIYQQMSLGSIRYPRAARKFPAGQINRF